MVFNIAPRLSWRPGLKGELTNCSDLFSRSPNRPRGVDVSKVSVSTVSCLIDVCRFDLHPTTSMPGPMDFPEMPRGVSVWLHDSGTSMVSRFDFWGLADFCRYEFDSPIVHLSEGSGRKQTNNQHKMTTVVSGGLPLRFWYQTSSRCIVHAFG